MRMFWVRKWGTNAQGFEITGNPINHEPETVIIKLPHGEVEISRTTSGEYWVHVAQKKDPVTNEYSGTISKLRIDSQNNEECCYETMNANHIAVLIGK